MAAPAGSAADYDHCHGAETDPVGAEQHKLDDVAAGPRSAVRPQLHPVTHPRFYQCPVCLAHADLSGEPDKLDGMLACRPGAAIVAADGDDIGACLCYAQGNGGHSGDRWNFHRDASGGIGRAQFLDDLGQILDRVDIMVIGRGDERHARGGIARRRDFCGHLEPG